MSLAVDVNLLRIAVTVVSFVAFVGIVAWAWSRARRAGFDEAARLPFVDAAPDPAAARTSGAARHV